MSALSKRDVQARSETHESDSFPRTSRPQAPSPGSQPTNASPARPTLSITSAASVEAATEVRWVMSHLRPEPTALAQKREALLQELEARIATTQGSLQALLTRLRDVLLSRRPGAAFQPRVAAEFAQALAHYKRSAEAGEPPAIIGQCFLYLREHVAGTGLAPLLSVVNTTSSLKKVSDTLRPWQQQRF